MATAYTGVIQAIGSSGRVYTNTFTATDVTTNYWIFPDGSSDLTYGEPVVIKDIAVSSTAGDTSTAHIYSNNLDTGLVVLKALNGATGVVRQFQGSPIPVKAGSRLRFQQIT